LKRTGIFGAKSQIFGVFSNPDSTSLPSGSGLTNLSTRNRKTPEIIGIFDAKSQIFGAFLTLSLPPALGANKASQKLEFLPQKINFLEHSLTLTPMPLKIRQNLGNIGKFQAKG